MLAYIAALCHVRGATLAIHDMQPAPPSSEGAAAAPAAETGYCGIFVSREAIHTAVFAAGAGPSVDASFGVWRCAVLSRSSSLLVHGPMLSIVLITAPPAPPVRRVGRGPALDAVPHRNRPARQLPPACRADRGGGSRRGAPSARWWPGRAARDADRAGRGRTCTTV